MAFEEFNPSKNYYAGKFIWKDSNLFQFIKDHSAGRWTGNDVKLVSGKRLVNMIEDEQQKEASKSEVLQPTESGSIVTPITAESQNASALTVNIDPVQDLHGYDNPWPAGGGKNKFQTTATTQTVNLVTFTVNDDGSVKASGTASANTNFRMGSVTLEAGTYILNGITSGSLSTYYIQVVSEDESTQLYLCYTSPVTMTFAETTTIVLRYRVMSGVSVSATIYPMIRLSSVSDATFAPYSNLCPITGHTSAVVTRTGRNVWDEVWEQGMISSTGDNYADASRCRSANYIPVKVGETYYCHAGSATVVNARYYDANKTWVANKSILNITFTIPSGVSYMRFYCNESTYANDISINYPATDTAYHAYSGTSVTIDLGGTRYGGTVDVLTGTMTVTKAIVDLGTLSYNYNNTRFNSSNLQGIISPPSSNSVLADIMCEEYTPVIGSTVTSTDNSIGLTNTGTVMVHDGRYTDATAFTSAVSGVQLCYTLATPLTVTLDPATLQLLAGENVVWASTGDVSVTYRADTKAYIDKLFTALQALALEN